MKKLDNINGHYLRIADDARLAALIGPLVGTLDIALLTRAMPVLKARAKSTLDLADGARFLFASRPLALDQGADALLHEDGRALVRAVRNALASSAEWSTTALEQRVRLVAEEAGLGLGKVAQPLRAALTGRTTSPGIFDVLTLLSREEALARLDDAVEERNARPQAAATAIDGDTGHG